MPNEIQEAVSKAKEAFAAVTVEMIDEHIDSLTRELIELQSLRAAKTGVPMASDPAPVKKERKKRTPKVAPAVDVSPLPSDEYSDAVERINE